MKADRELRTEVIAELCRDASVRDGDIAVAVHDGVVTLAGTVDSYAQRQAAERAVERVRGVLGIADDLIVAVYRNLAQSDAALACAAADALAWDVQVPAGRVGVEVANGWLTLTGEVDRYHQKEAAERAVRYLTGLRGVRNFIGLRAMPTPEDVTDRIRAGLEHAAIDQDRISIETSGSRITLRGTVRSLAERRRAERAAWSTPGVSGVDDDLTVLPAAAT
jgi:osmotically-inducible protein OsmY